MFPIIRCVARCPDVSMIHIRLAVNNVGCSSWTESLHHCPIQSVRSRWDNEPRCTAILVASCGWSSRYCNCYYSHQWPTCMMPNSSNMHWRIELQARTSIAWGRPVMLDQIAIASLWWAAGDCIDRPANIVCFAANWRDGNQSVDRDFDHLSPNLQRYVQINGRIDWIVV